MKSKIEEAKEIMDAVSGKNSLINVAARDEKGREVLKSPKANSSFESIMNILGEENQLQSIINRIENYQVLLMSPKDRLSMYADSWCKDFGDISVDKDYIKYIFDNKWCPEIITSNFMMYKLYVNFKNNSSESVLDKDIVELVNDTFLKELNDDISKTKLDDARKNIFKYSIDAYRRGEYVVTTTMLALMIEGLLHFKSGSYQTGGSNTSKDNKNAIRREFDENDDREVAIIEFYTKYILHQCKSESDVIVGIPGRHAIAHGWNINPTAKAAINAIIFLYVLIMKICENRQGTTTDVVV